MSEETLWTRAYGDEYWADVTSPLFFSLVGEYLTEYVNHEGARIMGYREEAWQGSTRISGWWYGGYLGAHTHKRTPDYGRIWMQAPSHGTDNVNPFHSSSLTLYGWRDSSSRSGLRF